MSAIAQAVLPRFWGAVDKTNLNGCWTWTRPLAKTGYGEISVDGRLQLAHRVSYELFVASIPETFTIDHLCHNADPTCCGGDRCAHRSCVNPAHLEPVPLELNIQRAWGRLERLTCSRGHYWTPENTGPVKGGYRRCRTCHRERERARLQFKAGSSS